MFPLYSYIQRQRVAQRATSSLIAFPKSKIESREKERAGEKRKWEAAAKIISPADLDSVGILVSKRGGLLHVVC